MSLKRFTHLTGRSSGHGSSLLKPQRAFGSRAISTAARPPPPAAAHARQQHSADDSHLPPQTEPCTDSCQPQPPSQLRATSPRVCPDQDNARSDESEEVDDSSDEGWSEAESPDGEEAVADSESSSEETEGEQDIIINLMERDVHDMVLSLIKADACHRRCLEGKEQDLQSLVCSMSQMTRSEKLTSIYSMLGLLMQTDMVERRRGKGDRDKFNYYLQFVGNVCRPSFARCLGVTPLSIQRYKIRVRDGNISAKSHGNTMNKHASAVDVPWLIKWFTEFIWRLVRLSPSECVSRKLLTG